MGGCERACVCVNVLHRIGGKTVTKHLYSIDDMVGLRVCHSINISLSSHIFLSWNVLSANEAKYLYFCVFFLLLLLSKKMMCDVWYFLVFQMVCGINMEEILSSSYV